jgi:class 3 adenylate cyclase
MAPPLTCGLRKTRFKREEVSWASPRPMDDTILLIYAPWAPNPETPERWPSVRVLVRELRHLLPIEHFVWDTRANNNRYAEMTPWPEQLRDQVRPHHHIVDVSGVVGEETLQVVSESVEPPRSITVAGFFVGPRTARALGMETLAEGMEATEGLMATAGAQLLAMSMQGADEDYVAAETRLVMKDLDLERYRAQWTRPAQETRGIDFSKVPVRVDIPVLLLSSPMAISGADEQAEIYRRFVPGARVEQLHSWPLRLHEEEGGRELAAKVLSFIREVTAGRAAAARGEEGRTRQHLTLLFTDIVSSTQRALELGDEAWHDLVERHNALVRGELRIFGGREVDTAGDGFLAVFDAPDQAVKCAAAIRQGLLGIDLQIRAGLHSGAVESVNGKVRGIAVHEAARIASKARPGEIVVSATLRELVCDSALEFDDRGRHTLKGLPGRFRLFALADRELSSKAEATT